MEKHSDREASELLKQLQEFVEKDQAAQASQVEQNTEAQDLSVEELLDQFMQSAGTTSSPTKKRGASEYDISGYIEDFVDADEADEQESEVITEVAAEETRETASIAQVNAEAAEEASDLSTTVFEEQTTLTAEQEEYPVVEEEMPTNVSDSEENAEIAQENVTVETENADLVVEDDSEPILDNDENTVQSKEETLAEVASKDEADDVIDVQTSNEESLRRQVETFVLDTLDPEEETSILDSIAGLAARNRKAEEDSVIEDKETAGDLDETCEPVAASLEEPCNEQAVKQEQEELPYDYVANDVMERFFKKNTSSHQQNAGESFDFDYKDFNDVDINLALTLGCEEELHDAFGFSRVRAAKNGFHDPAEETMISSAVFAGDGTEFRSYDQVEDIKQRYQKEKKHLYKRFAFTFLLTVFILFFEHIFLTSISIPYVSEFFAVKWRYYLVSILLSVLCILCSGRRLLGGCLSIFSMKPDSYTPPAAFAFLHLLYELITLIFYPNDGFLTYNFVMAIFFLLAIWDEYMRLMRESMTFDVISDRRPRLSLERFEGEGEMKKDGSYLGRHDFFVDKVSFVGNYFSRIGKIPTHQKLYGLGFISIILGGIVMMLISAYTSNDLGNAFQTFFFWIMLCVPMCCLPLGSYPFYLLSKGLRKLDSAILGEGVVDEYAITDTIYLGDDEMFGRHGASVVGLRLYGDMDFYELLYYAFAVFSNLGAPLCHIFDTSTKEIPKPQEVKINAVSVGGIEATVDCEHKVTVGNMAFMRSKGFFPKRNLDDEKKIESGQTSIVYIAIDGVLCAKLYIKYTITKRFEKFVEEMVENEIAVGIRSIDPSVNERMISILRGHKAPEIRVIRPTANELTASEKHSDSGIITGRNSHMIFRILQQCLHIQNVHKKQVILHVVSILLGAGGVVALMLTNRFGTIPPIIVAMYHMLWVLIGWIYTKSKLK